MVEQWSHLLRNGYVVERPDRYGDLMSLMALMRTDKNVLGEQKAVMTLISPFWMTELPTQYHEELDFFRFPTMDTATPGAEVVTTLGYMAPSNGQHRAETLAFLTYMGSKEGRPP